MPYYLYLEVQDKVGKKLRDFWAFLKQGVLKKHIPDLSSLMFPPHITLMGRFENTEEELKVFIQDIKKTFSGNCNEIKDFRFVRSDKFMGVYFDQKELSDKMKLLKEKYPDRMTITEDFHLTLVHSPKPISEKSLQKLEGIINSFLDSLKFSIVLWHYTETPGDYSWEKRRWEKILVIPYSKSDLSDSKK